ncbi:MAG TPA: RNA polymerase sigma factor [Polyangia bacterium]
MSRSLPLKSSEALGDEELVRRALRGDRWGREMLYRRHAGTLLAMTTRLLGNRGEAEEVVQDTFVTAFERLETLRDPGAVGGWLGQVAVNLVRRRFRKLRLLRFLGLDNGADDATLEALADGSVPTDERAELALVDRKLRALKPEVRLAWTLRRVEGLELAEVASLARCSLATTKRRIAAGDAVLDPQGSSPEALS